MQVQNIECQIAQAQIGRFVSGGALSPEALTQLEGHIGECAECETFLAERKAALQAILAGGAKAAVEMPLQEPARSAGGPLARLREQLAAKVEPLEAREPKPDRRTTLKPLILSGALALVLVAMSLLTKNPTALFGDKALPAAAAAPALTPAQDAKPAKTASPAASTTPPKAAPISHPSPTTPPPAVESAAAKPSTRPATPRPAATQPAPKPAPKLRRPTGSIRVYDANGNPISPNGR